jgi:hypothetical protein
MEDVVGAFGLWGCSVLAVLATGWGVGVLVTGRAPQRELRQFQSVSQYGRSCVGLGVALGFVALGSGLGGWFGLLTLVGLGVLAWLVIQNRRSHRKAVQQRSTATS